MKRYTPNFRPTHFTSLFDATAYSVAARRYAMLTGAFERAKQEDRADELQSGWPVPRSFRQLSQQQLSNFREQERRAGEMMQQSYTRMVAFVEALGGEVIHPFIGHGDYCEIRGLTEAQAKAVIAKAYRV